MARRRKMTPERREFINGLLEHYNQPMHPRCSRNVEGSFGRYPARNARSRNGSETWLFEV